MRKLFLGISIIFMFFEMIFAKHCDPVKEFCEYKNIEEYDNDDSSFHNSTVFNFENTVGVINRGGFESGNLEELDIVNQTSYDVPWMKICSGTLIGPDLFLTAAHCIKDKPADEDDPFKSPLRKGLTDKI